MPRSGSGLLPYAGPEIYRIQRLGSPHAQTRYGDDQSGEHLYRFNSLGFRGGEFDPGARFRVFAFGESHAFGYGVEFHECWPSRFVARWLEARGLDRRDVCYMNFADPGASNGSIARAVISQCSAVEPDLVLVNFGDSRRSEIFLDGRPHRIGPWLLEEPAERAAREAPDEENLREILRELLARGREFYRFAGGSDTLGRFSVETDSYFLLETLRNILLAQFFCRSRGIPAVATWDHVRQLFAEDVRGHESLGPLVRQIDTGFLCDFSIWDVGSRSGNEEHVAPERHDAFAQALFEFHENRLKAPKPGGDEAPASEVRASVERRRVREFYDRKPFNHWRTAEEAAESLGENPIADAYPDLHRLLGELDAPKVLDCGCGSGWLTGSLALHYGVETTGIDFSLPAVARARAVGERLGVGSRVRLVAGDLFELRFDDRFDLAISLGVLHHSIDAHLAFEHLRRAVRPGGRLYVGLYHEPGRKVFLDHFDEIVEREGEEAAFWEFRRLHPSRRNSEHLRSWFHDQVRHPLESRHTLREVYEWLSEARFELISTSINRFEPISQVEELFELESDFERRARRALEEGRFFPGFFTFLARRP